MHGVPLTSSMYVCRYHAWRALSASSRVLLACLVATLPEATLGFLESTGRSLPSACVGV